MFLYVPALSMGSFLNITPTQKWNSLNKVPCERLARLRKWPLYVWSSAVICHTIFLSKVRAQRGKCLNISLNFLHSFSVVGPKRFCRSNPDTYFVWLLSSACSLSFFSKSLIFHCRPQSKLRKKSMLVPLPVVKSLFYPISHPNVCILVVAHGHATRLFR